MVMLGNLLHSMLSVFIYLRFASIDYYFCCEIVNSKSNFFDCDIIYDAMNCLQFMDITSTQTK
jgi:hypothetical protein